MKFAVSNIALSAYGHAGDFPRLAEMGLDAVEVAPSRVWRDTWKGLSAGAVADYQRHIEGAGLSVVGLHSLFFDHPALGLFKGRDARADSLDFLEHLSEVCRDLGGKTLIYGSGRRRGDWAAGDAWNEAVNFFGELCARVEGHGTCFCFEPLGPNDTDFINSAKESLAIVNEINHPALGVQLDAKALVENNEVDKNVFEAVKPKLVHYHANEPGLGVLGTSGKVDHHALGGMLRDIGYDSHISIEQRMLEGADPLTSVKASVDILKSCYGMGRII